MHAGSNAVVASFVQLHFDSAGRQIVRATDCWFAWTAHATASHTEYQTQPYVDARHKETAQSVLEFQCLHDCLLHSVGCLLLARRAWREGARLREG